jgi:hypothetical protein
MRFIGIDFGFGRDRAAASVFETGEDGCLYLVEETALRRPAWRDRILRHGAARAFYRRQPAHRPEGLGLRYRRLRRRLWLTTAAVALAAAYGAWLAWEASR